MIARRSKNQRPYQTKNHCVVDRSTYRGGRLDPPILLFVYLNEFIQQWIFASYCSKRTLLSAGFTFELGFDVGKHEIFAKAWLKFTSIGSALRGIHKWDLPTKYRTSFSLLGGSTYSSVKVERSCHRFRRSERSLTMLIICIAFFFKYELTHFVTAVVCTNPLYQLRGWIF